MCDANQKEMSTVKLKRACWDQVQYRAVKRAGYVTLISE